MKFRKIFFSLIILILLAQFIPVSYASVNESDLDITSEAAILVDRNTGKILYGKNEKEKKYPASTTKILTAILTIENCNLDDVATVSYDAVYSVPSGYTVASLQVGEELTVNQLLQVLLIHSANDAANVLAEYVGGTVDSFVSMMNTKLEELGCTDSHFTNPSGKHDDNHYTTAYDLAILMDYCMKNSTFKEIASSTSCIIPATNKYSERVYTNTNELLNVDTREDIESNYYYKYAVAGKTGYTSEAKNCLVSLAEKDGFELICVILGAGKISNGLSARFIETKKIYEYGYNTYTNIKLREKGAIAKQIEISNATQDTKDLDLLISDDINVLIKQSDIDSTIEPVIKLNEDLVAPIVEGTVLGTITYTVEDIEYTSNLVASHTVEKNNIFFYIVQTIFIIVVLFLLYKVISNKSNKKLLYRG